MFLSTLPRMSALSHFSFISLAVNCCLWFPHELLCYSVIRSAVDVIEIYTLGFRSTSFHWQCRGIVSDKSVTTRTIHAPLLLNLAGSLQHDKGYWPHFKRWSQQTSHSVTSRLVVFCMRFACQAKARLTLLLLVHGYLVGLGPPCSGITTDGGSLLSVSQRCATYMKLYPEP